MILKKIFIFLVLALLFYLIGSFINWELNVEYWGVRSRVTYIIGAVITLFQLLINDFD